MQLLLHNIKEIIVVVFHIVQCRCLFLALKIWAKHGGKLLIIFQPLPHVIVICGDGIIRHGTNRKTGIWRIEDMSSGKFIYWMNLNGK